MSYGLVALVLSSIILGGHSFEIAMQDWKSIETACKRCKCETECANACTNRKGKCELVEAEMIKRADVFVPIRVAYANDKAAKYKKYCRGSSFASFNPKCLKRVVQITTVANFVQKALDPSTGSRKLDQAAQESAVKAMAEALKSIVDNKQLKKLREFVSTKKKHSDDEIVAEAANVMEENPDKSFSTKLRKYLPNMKAAVVKMMSKKETDEVQLEKVALTQDRPSLVEVTVRPSGAAPSKLVREDGSADFGRAPAVDKSLVDTGSDVVPILSGLVGLAYRACRAVMLAVATLLQVLVALAEGVGLTGLLLLKLAAGG